MEIKQLRKEFDGIGEVRGYKFTQIRSTSKGFIYEVCHNGTKHYEVFRKYVNSRYGVISYPSSKAFGIWAWTCKSMERANKLLAGIELLPNNKNEYHETN